VPRLAVDVMGTPGVAAVPLRNPGVSRTLGIVAKRGLPLSPAADALLGIIRKRMRADPEGERGRQRGHRAWAVPPPSSGRTTATGF